MGTFTGGRNLLSHQSLDKHHDLHHTHRSYTNMAVTHLTLALVVFAAVITITDARKIPEMLCEIYNLILNNGFECNGDNPYLMCQFFTILYGELCADGQSLRMNVV